MCRYYCCICLSQSIRPFVARSDPTQGSPDQHPSWDCRIPPGRLSPRARLGFTIKINPFLSTEIGDLYFCHHVIIVSNVKTFLQSAFFVDVERCCLDGT